MQICWFEGNRETFALIPRLPLAQKTFTNWKSRHVLLSNQSTEIWELVSLILNQSMSIVLLKKKIRLRPPKINRQEIRRREGASLNIYVASKSWLLHSAAIFIGVHLFFQIRISSFPDIQPGYMQYSVVTLFLVF